MRPVLSDQGSPSEPERPHARAITARRWLFQSWRPAFLDGFAWTRRSAALVSITLLVTTGLWAAAHVPDFTRAGFLPWPALAQLTVLWSITLMSVTLLAVIRANALEPVFGGLDRGVHLHRLLGAVTVLLLAVHVLCLMAVALRDGTPLMGLLVPFSGPGVRSADILVFYLILAGAALAWDRRMRHERWLAIHRCIGLLLLGGTAHAAVEPGTIASFEPLRTWVVILLLVGAGAWLYRVFLFDHMGPRYLYRVEQAVPHGPRFLDLVMRPVDRRMMYEPGTFLFLRVPGLAAHRKELHPFSISSSPVEQDLRVSVRRVGDFTRALGGLERHTPVELFGPFGGFTPQRFAGYRRLACIGAGIGITPFLGMLQFELANRDFRRIWLYYVARDPGDAVYDQEIRDTHLLADSYVDYYLWLTAERGRLRAADVAAEIAPLDNWAVMLCGTTQFVDSLAHQFRLLGLPRERIITEQLQFR